MLRRARTTSVLILSFLLLGSSASLADLVRVDYDLSNTSVTMTVDGNSVTVPGVSGSIALFYTRLATMTGATIAPGPVEIASLDLSIPYSGMDGASGAIAFSIDGGWPELSLTTGLALFKKGGGKPKSQILSAHVPSGPIHLPASIPAMIVGSQYVDVHTKGIAAGGTGVFGSTLTGSMDLADAFTTTTGSLPVVATIGLAGQEVSRSIVPETPVIGTPSIVALMVAVGVTGAAFARMRMRGSQP